MRTLILSQANILAGSNNSVLDFQFPGGGVNIKAGTTVDQRQL